MKCIKMLFKFVGRLILGTVILMICSSILFVAYKGNQPMKVSQVPKGMTYFEFIGDRIDAAKTVKPASVDGGCCYLLEHLDLFILWFTRRLEFIRMGLLLEASLMIWISLKGLKEHRGMRFRGFGGIQWSDFPGRCWGSRRRMGVS